MEDPIKIKKLVSGAQTRVLADGLEVGATLGNKLNSFFNQSISQLRSQGRTLEAIRALARSHGDASAAVAAKVRLSNTSIHFRVYDTAHQLSAGGSDLLRFLLTRMDYSSDYTAGYDERMALSGVKEAMLRSVDLTGACALELVLDKQRIPYQFHPVSVETLKFVVGRGNRVVPAQTDAKGKLIPLDIPNFFYAALDQDLTSAYSFSPIEPALNTSFFHSETVEDIRRVVKRSGHSRLIVKLITEALLNHAPTDIRGDAKKLGEWMEETRVQVKNVIESLEPESALVLFDTLEADYLNSEIGASADYKPLMELIDAILATALKTPAAVVGKRTTGGSQNTSSTESLLFIKTAAGLQPPVRSVLSRAMTLAVRLMGFAGYVDVQFEEIDLRPDIELEAFRQMKQARIMELWSVGNLTDAEAAELLGTGPRSPNAPALSGTFFYKPNSSLEVPSPNADPIRRALTTDAPKSGGGRDQTQRS